MIPSPLDGEGLARLLAQPGLGPCLAALRIEGEETRLVGGCVRDALLGRTVSDIDLATTLEPARTIALAQAIGLKAVPTGFEHGTVTLVVSGRPFEVTTLREDIETDGRHAIVRFGRDFARDAERRDFTINALSLSADGRLHDTTGGLTDLAAGRVRFIGDPATRIREDALRILRFFRFHARYGDGEADREGLMACVTAQESLERLSRERVRSEFLKLLAAPRVVATVALMSAMGLLSRITGTVAELGRLSRACTADLSVETRLAALTIHTIEDADRMRDRLRLSRAEHAHLAAYASASAAMRSPDTIDLGMLRGLMATHGAGTIRTVMRILQGEPRPALTAEVQAYDWTNLEDDRLVFPVSGRELVARGLPPGPGVGRALAAARRLWLDEGCPADEGIKARLIAVALAAAETKKPADTP